MVDTIDDMIADIIDNKNNNLHAFQLIVARYLLGVPKP